MTTAITKSSPDAAMMESVVIGGDLSQLTPTQRVSYYMQTCQSLGLNPLTKPFDYLKLNGQLRLYARKDATDQLRNIQKISLGKPETELVSGIFTVSITASTPDGRTDADMGAVSVENIKGDALANAMMKAITKAKRRVTLSICGLGMMDETEIETVPDARPVVVTAEGEIVEPPARQPAPTKTTAPDLKIAEALVKAGVCQHSAHAVQLITGYMPLEIQNDAEKAIAWGKLYRGWRDAGTAVQQAAENATAGASPQ